MDIFEVEELIKNDSEVLFSISKSSLTFLRFYRHSLYLLKTHQYEKAKKTLTTAEIFKSNDYKTKVLMEEIDKRIKEEEASESSSIIDSIEEA